MPHFAKFFRGSEDFTVVGKTRELTSVAIYFSGTTVTFNPSLYPPLDECYLTLIVCFHNDNGTFSLRPPAPSLLSCFRPTSAGSGYDAHVSRSMVKDASRDPSMWIRFIMHFPPASIQSDGLDGSSVSSRPFTCYKIISLSLSLSQSRDRAILSLH